VIATAARAISLLVGIVVVAAHAPGLHRNGRIAFVTDQQLSTGGLVTIAPRGGGVTVVAAPTLEAPPVPSPDGTRLALVVGRVVEVVRTDGRHRVVIGDGRSPTWSADGTQLVFVADSTSKLEIAPSAGGPPRDLGVSGSEPVWSPSGEWIAFFSAYSTLELIHPNGTGRTLLATDADSLPGELPVAWSHDGEWLSFGAAPADTHVLELDVIRPDGSGRRSFGNGTAPAWSPRADVFAFVSSDVGFEVVAPDGSARFTSDSVGGTPVWSPSGNAVALGTYDQPGVWIVDPASGATRRLSLGGVPTWSPNQMQIAAIRGFTLRVVAAAGGRPRALAAGASAPLLWLPNGRIAFDASARIRTVIETDSGRVLLRGPAHFDIGSRVEFTGLTWSPDGSAFAAVYGTELWTAAANGTRARVLAHDVTDIPSWSPDGSRLVFAAGGLRIASAYGGAGGRLLTRVADVAPTWSPDGRHIAFENGNGALYVIEPDGRRMRRLTDNISSAPSWSPDGTRIAFSVGEAYEPTAIETIRADGGGLTKVVSAPAAGDTGDVLFAPEWSPDGRTILYSDDEYLCGSKCDELHLMLVRPDGTAKRRLPSTLDNAEWSPDGKELIGQFGDASLAIADVGTGRRRSVGPPTEAWSWQPLAP
jgi:Tol biopolymer transport system component